MTSSTTRFVETPLIRKKIFREAIAKWIFFGMTVAMIVPLLLIISFLVIKAMPALSIDFLLDPPMRGMKAGGIWPAFVGTIYLVLISLAVAAPVGVLAAVYLNEYAKDNWLNRLVNLAVINLAGVPSIVHALFGLGAFVLAAGIGKSVMAASLTLAVMTLPVIIASTREALSSVPMTFREACWNVGATRWQTIKAVVLPTRSAEFSPASSFKFPGLLVKRRPSCSPEHYSLKRCNAALCFRMAWMTNAWPCPCTFTSSPRKFPVSPNP